MSNAPDYVALMTKDYLLAELLASVPDIVDKRVGAVIYDTLAPLAEQLAEAYALLAQAYEDTYVTTATAKYLDLRVAEIGLTRETATAAIREGRFYGAGGVLMDIPLGSRFSIISTGDGQMSYQAVEQIASGVYRMQAEHVGTVGNDYLGQLLPITHIPGLERAMLGDILIPGSDIETDEHLLDRYLEYIKARAFAGNLAAYRQAVTELPGVGAVQVYPHWDGWGTVKCSILDSLLQPPSQTLLDEVQEAIDPPPQAMGIGIASISHEVTIQGGVARSIAVSATVTVANGYTLDELRPQIIASIESYFAETRQAWGVPSAGNVLDYALWVFRARVLSQFFAVPGVINVEDLLLNGGVADIELIETSSIQEVPMLGEVTLVEPS